MTNGRMTDGKMSDGANLDGFTADFPEIEYQRRLQKAQKLMHAQGLDAIFLTTEAEVRYFSGFRTQFWLSPSRPWYLILPRSGEPIAIIPEIGAELMGKTWVKDIRTWAAPNPEDEGRSLLKDCLSAYSTIGMPMGAETSFRMPMLDFEWIKREISAQFVDCTHIISQLRMVKSEREIEIIQEICAIASRSFDRASELFYPGQNFDDCFKAFKIALLQEGADDVPYLVGGKGQLGYGDVISPPNQSRLEAGDILMLDTGATLKGYYCDFDRNFALEKIDEAVELAYDKLWLATEAALETVRPGMRACDLFKVMNDQLGGENSSVGRFGHGLGMQLTEWPSLINWDKTPIEENMVITLEPSIAVTDETMLVTEENIVIRDGAPQLLSKRAPRELPIL